MMAPFLAGRGAARDGRLCRLHRSALRASGGQRAGEGGPPERPQPAQSAFGEAEQGHSLGAY